MITDRVGFWISLACSPALVCAAIFVLAQAFTS